MSLNFASLMAVFVQLVCTREAFWETKGGQLIAQSLIWEQLIDCLTLAIDLSTFLMELTELNLLLFSNTAAK